MSDLESVPFWDGVRDKEVRLQRCKECGRHRFPPLPGCPYCSSVEAAWETSSGNGTVYSWVRVHRPFAAEFTGDVPYTVAVVELEEGPRLLARVEPHAGIGAKVTAVFHDGELRFTSAAP